MNGPLFSIARYMNGVCFKVSGGTSVPKIPPSYPTPPPPPPPPERRNNSILVPIIRKETFSKSYFPKTIREWNNLSNETKASESVNIFKSKMKEIYEPNKSNPRYGHGHGWSQVNHCRMRLGLSHLRKQRTSSIVQVIFSFWSFEIREDILRNQKFIIGSDSFCNQYLIYLVPFRLY